MYCASQRGSAPGCTECLLTGSTGKYPCQKTLCISRIHRFLYILVPSSATGRNRMKKWLLLSFCSVFIPLLSGCSPETLLNRIMPSDNQEIQDIHPDSTRVYMDDCRELSRVSPETNSLLSVLLYPIRLMFLRPLWNLRMVLSAETLSV